jgi:glycosyltransferase involved in cell wall biosynthesis
MAPQVTVVVPMYNAAPWIAATLQSVRDQTYPAECLEVVIVDDRSSDASIALATDFLTRNGMRGVVLGSQRNAGASAARNRGWAAAAGEWIQFLDADDLLAPDKIEIQSRLLAGAADDVAVICSGWQRLALQGSEWRPFGPVVFPNFGDSPVLDIVSHAGFLGPALIRKRYLETVGGLSEEVKHAEDEHLMLKIAAAGGKFAEAVSAAPMFFVRQTPASKSRGAVSKLARQHIKNVVTAERMLRDRNGRVSVQESKVIASLCDWTLSQLYEHDRPAFREYLQWLRDVDPTFLPEHSHKLKLATRVLGYENAEIIALAYRRARSWCARRIGRLSAKPVPVSGR